MMECPMTRVRSAAPIIARPAGFMSSRMPSRDTSFTHAGSALMIARSRLSLSAFSASADSSALGGFRRVGVGSADRRVRDLYLLRFMR
jgi:hypothetical protein